MYFSSMCNHVSIRGSQYLKVELPDYRVDYNNNEPYYHVSGFTRPFLPVTMNTDQKAVIAAQWKLIPFWVKNEESAKKYANTLNAKSESIFQAASYKPYINKYRGLLWIDGFFEPHKNEKTGAAENYYIYTPDKELFTLGIVVAPWTNQETGEIVNTFSIITTDANPLLAEIHNEKKRMPLVIPESDRDAWLNADNKDQIQSLMVPYEGELSAHKVYRVTADRTGNTNRPDIQNPI